MEHVAITSDLDHLCGETPLIVDNRSENFGPQKLRVQGLWLFVFRTTEKWRRMQRRNSTTLRILLGVLVISCVTGILPPITKCSYYFGLGRIFGLESCDLTGCCEQNPSGGNQNKMNLLKWANMLIFNYYRLS